MVCLLNKISFVVVGDIYSRHMFRTPGTSQFNNEYVNKGLIRVEILIIEILTY